MIIRIFKTKVPLRLHGEFKEKFKEISVPMVQKYNGLIAIEIGEPSKWSPEEFVMISKWESEQNLIDFAGEDWSQAHIPENMAKYISEWEIHHYYSIDI